MNRFERRFFVIQQALINGSAPPRECAEWLTKRQAVETCGELVAQGWLDRGYRPSDLLLALTHVDTPSERKERAALEGRLAALVERVATKHHKQEWERASGELQYSLDLAGLRIAKLEELLGVPGAEVILFPKPTHKTEG